MTYKELIDWAEKHTEKYGLIRDFCRVDGLIYEYEGYKCVGYITILDEIGGAVRIFRMYKPLNKSGSFLYA